jgi:hypothetical protein
LEKSAAIIRSIGLKDKALVLSVEKSLISSIAVAGSTSSLVGSARSSLSTAKIARGEIAGVAAIAHQKKHGTETDDESDGMFHKVDAISYERPINAMAI